MASRNDADLALPDANTVGSGPEGVHLSIDLRPTTSAIALEDTPCHTASTDACASTVTLRSESQLEKEVTSKADKLDSAVSTNQDFHASMPEVPSATAAMPAVTSDSAVAHSEQAGKSDKTLLSFQFIHGPESGPLKAENISAQATSSSTNSQQDATQQTLSQEASTPSGSRHDAGHLGSPSAPPRWPRIKSSTTSEMAPVSSRVPTTTSNAPTRRSQAERRDRVEVDTERLLGLLLANLKDNSGESSRDGRGLPFVDGGTTRLPFSVSTRSAQPSARLMANRGAFASGLPTSKPAKEAKGYDLFQFATRAGCASVFLLFVLYMLKGLRSHVLSCGDYNNCTGSSPIYLPPNI